MAEDGVKVGDGYIEIRPELDKSSMARVSAEMLGAMQASYDQDTRNRVQAYQKGITQQLGYQKIANNQVMQAAAALEKQRTSALQTAEKERTKVTQAAEAERERAMKARLKGETTSYRLAQADMVSTFEAASRARQQI